MQLIGVCLYTALWPNTLQLIIFFLRPSLTLHFSQKLDLRIVFVDLLVCFSGFEPELYVTQSFACNSVLTNSHTAKSAKTFITVLHAQYQSHRQLTSLFTLP